MTIINHRLSIRLRSNSSKSLDISAREIVKMSKKAGCKVSGPVPMPSNIHKITVNKSPHVYKKSREQFEIRTLSRLIVIHFPVPELVNDISDFQLPPGVSFNVFTHNKNDVFTDAVEETEHKSKQSSIVEQKTNTIANKPKAGSKKPVPEKDTKKPKRMAETRTKAKKISDKQKDSKVSEKSSVDQGKIKK